MVKIPTYERTRELTATTTGQHATAEQFGSDIGKAQQQMGQSIANVFSSLGEGLSNMANQQADLDYTTKAASFEARQSNKYNELLLTTPPDQWLDAREKFLTQYDQDVQQTIQGIAPQRQAKAMGHFSKFRSTLDVRVSSQALVKGFDFEGTKIDQAAAEQARQVQNNPEDIDAATARIRAVASATRLPLWLQGQRVQQNYMTLIDAGVQGYLARGDVAGARAYRDKYIQMAPKLFQEYGTTQQNQTYVPTGPLTRTDKANNPGAIEAGSFAQSQGATGSDGRYATFPTREHGFRAAEMLLNGPQYMGKTLRQIGYQWVGPGERQEQWIANVSKATGIPPDVVPNAAQRQAIVRQGMPIAEGSALKPTPGSFTSLALIPRPPAATQPAPPAWAGQSTNDRISALFNALPAPMQERLKPYGGVAKAVEITVRGDATTAMAWKFLPDEAKQWLQSNAGKYGLQIADKDKPWVLTPAALPAAPKPTATDQSGRPFYFRGTLTMDGKAYEYGTGGKGRGSIPLGEHTITRFTSGEQRAAEGRSYRKDAFEIKDMWDPKVGDIRAGIVIHNATDIDKLYSAGCLAVNPQQWPEFRAHLLDVMQRSDGKLTLTINQDGSAFINPRTAPKTTITATETVKQTADNTSGIIPAAAGNLTDNEEGQDYVTDPATGQVFATGAGRKPIVPNSGNYDAGAWNIFQNRSEINIQRAERKIQAELAKGKDEMNERINSDLRSRAMIGQRDEALNPEKVGRIMGAEHVEPWLRKGRWADWFYAQTQGFKNYPSEQRAAILDRVRPQMPGPEFQFAEKLHQEAVTLHNSLNANDERMAKETVNATIDRLSELERNGALTADILRTTQEGLRANGGMGIPPNEYQQFLKALTPENPKDYGRKVVKTMIAGSDLAKYFKGLVSDGVENAIIGAREADAVMAFERAFDAMQSQKGAVSREDANKLAKDVVFASGLSVPYAKIKTTMQLSPFFPAGTLHQEVNTDTIKAARQALRQALPMLNDADKARHFDNLKDWNEIIGMERTQEEELKRSGKTPAAVGANPARDRMLMEQRQQQQPALPAPVQPGARPSAPSAPEPTIPAIPPQSPLRKWWDQLFPGKKTLEDIPYKPYEPDTYYGE